MIPYVQFRNSLDIPPPYSMPGVTVHAFVWDAPVRAIQAYCDRYFNLGEAADRGWAYGPAAIWPYVMLLVIDYPVMSYAGQPVPESDPGEVPLGNRGPAKRLQKEFDLDYEWDGDVLVFERPGVNGELTVAPKHVEMEVKLGFLLRIMKPTIEKNINQNLDEIFATHSKAKPKKA